MRAAARATAAALAAAATIGCGKTPGTSAPAPTPAPTLSPAPALSHAPPAREDWRGSYESAAGTLYIPPAWKNVRWRGDDTDAGVGDGTMTLSCDTASGRVTGTIEGPLGPARLRGAMSDAGVTATIVRADPADHGFTGTLEGAIAGGRARGTMNVSLGEAGAIRTARFDLAPDASGSARDR